MVKKNLKIFVTTLLLLIISVNCYSDSIAPQYTGKVPIGSWVAVIDKVGKVAIKCSRYRSDVSCKMFWVFSEVRGLSSKVENGNLKLFNKEFENEHLLISLVNNAPHKILKSGLLEPGDFSGFESSQFIKGNYNDVASSNRRNSDYNKYHKRGKLKTLPDSFPAWFINPTAYLFKNEKPGAAHGFSQILGHEKLTPKTLKHMYKMLLTKRDYISGYLVIIARNPSTSKDVLKSLFNTEDSVRNYTSIWHAVSNNPSAPPLYRKEYFKRIKNGGKKMQEDMLYDRGAPPELLDWIVRNGSISYFRSRIFSHKNIWPKTLDYLSEKKISGESLRRIAENKNISDKTLNKLVKLEMKDKHNQRLMLRTISGYHDRSPEAAAIALSSLVKSGDMSSMTEAARHPRLTKSLIDILIKSEFITIRKTLAQKKTLGLLELKKLAKDDYSYVSETARKQLSARFKNEYTKISSTLKSLEDLNQAISLYSEIENAIKQKDINVVNSVIGKFKRHNIRFHANLNDVFSSGNKDIAKIIFNSEKYVFSAIMKSKNLNIDWLEFLLKNKAFEVSSEYKALATCITMKRMDYFNLFLKYGYDINSIDKRTKGNLLYPAIAIRDLDILTFLLDKGVSKEIKNRRRGTPAEFAKKINFVSAVKILNKGDEHAKYIAEHEEKYTPNSKSMLIGEWSNQEGEFKTSNITFNKDGSGRMMGAVGGILLVWRQLSESMLEITPNINGKLKKSKIMNFNYELEENILSLWPENKKSKKIIYFRQGVVSELMTVSNDDSDIDEKYTGTWFNEKDKITLTITLDSMAIINKKSKLELKNGAGNYILAFRGRYKKTNKEKPLVFILNKAKTILTVTSGGQLSEFKRINE